MRAPRAPRPATAPRSNHDAPESPRAGARRPAPGDTAQPTDAAQPADADNAADASPDPISPAVFLEPADGSTFVAGAQVQLLGQLVGPGPTANVQVWCINATKGVAAGQAPLATDDGGVFALSWVVKPGSQTLRCSAGAIDDPALYAEVSLQGNVEPSTPVLSVDPLQAAWAQPPLDPDTPDSALQTQSATAAIIDVDVCDTALSPCAAEGTCTETPGLDALIGVARVGTEIAELEDAERAARRAIEEATELGARHHVLAARIQLGAALLLRGDRPEAAAETFEAAVEEADRLGESSQRIYALSQLSMVHAHNARLAEADELARKTLADLDERLDRRGWAGVGRLHSMLGLVCQRSGRFDEAGSQYGPDRRAIKRSGDQGAVCMIEISVGNLLYRQDRKEEAAAQFARAAKAAGSIDYRFGEAVARNNLGDALLQLGRPSDALASLDAAASTFRQLGVDDYEADSMRLTALAQLALGEQDKARETIDKALQLKVDERFKKGIDAASEQIRAAVATA